MADLPPLPASLDADPRARRRNDRPVDASGRCVVYWVQRAQRAFDNPALDAAVEAANALGKPLVVFHGLTPRYPNANERHYAFLLDGIADLARGVEARGAAFAFRPWPANDLVRFAAEVRAALVVGDENPLREPERWRRAAAERLPTALVTVDADVVVPSALFPKEEYAARTIRPKIHAHLERFLVPSREPRARVAWPSRERPASLPLEKAALLRDLPLDRSAAPVPGARGGSKAGLAALRGFLDGRLARYHERRNRPEHADGTSLLSAYLHFGHLGPRGVALAARDSGAPPEAVAAFLEELIVRRELAVNYVARNPAYDRYEGLHAWARRSLEERLSDARAHLYSDAQLERGETHDPLWNAAQREMVRTGRMHGYLRMYWAKKILEWTEHPAAAFDAAVRLNDRYELDGRDPNGYTGIAWAIGGKHDRPWAPARPIFGTIRYMSLASTSRKFDGRAYMARVAALEAGRPLSTVSAGPGAPAPARGTSGRALPSRRAPR
jgi:deoxyribodipyrimidine photo-lyase